MSVLVTVGTPEKAVGLYRVQNPKPVDWVGTSG